MKSLSVIPVPINKITDREMLLRDASFWDEGCRLGERPRKMMKKTL
jgi:hypothetical protein